MKFPFAVKRLKEDSTDIAFFRGFYRQPRLRKFRRTVTCRIVDGADAFIGTAYYNPNDRGTLAFDVRFGMKIAFQKALENLPRGPRKTKLWKIFLKSQGVKVPA
jgi:hypothetical protein